MDAEVGARKSYRGEVHNPHRVTEESAERGSQAGLEFFALELAPEFHLSLIPLLP